MNPASSYSAILVAPFGALGIVCDCKTLYGIDFLHPDTLSQSPEEDFTHSVCTELASYFSNPDHKFNLPLHLNGTIHQNKVWAAMVAIPRGKTMQYGELAKKISSSARAVGQACGANPIPIVVPCHRVVSKAGIGGFAHHSAGYELDIKRWLLNHEQY